MAFNKSANGGGGTGAFVVLYGQFDYPNAYTLVIKQLEAVEKQDAVLGSRADAFFDGLQYRCDMLGMDYVIPSLFDGDIIVDC